MAHASNAPAFARRRMALVLLATTAIAAVAGGCTQSGPVARLSGQPKLGATDAVGAVAQWSAAYAKKPQDAKTALGYAAALKAIGSRERAFEVLVTAYRTNPDNGEIAAELGRVALDMGRLEVAVQTLQVAEAQGLRDWRTLSAQGTLRAKRGKHAEAQQYFLAALQEKPDAISVINNLALSYALDGKAGKSEELLRKAVASGHEDKRVRQNLALVLGLQGKFEEARKIASVDLTPDQAKSSMAYLRNMTQSSTQLAAAPPGGDGSVGDWEPFASTDEPEATAPKTAAAKPPAPNKMQVVKAEEAVETPHARPESKKLQTASEPKREKMAGTPTLVTPVGAVATKSRTAAGSKPSPITPEALLRTDTY